jgi:hypothetical protein
MESTAEETENLNSTRETTESSENGTEDLDSTKEIK